MEEDNPPSYNSLFNKNAVVGSASKIWNIMAGTVCCTVFTGLFMAIPLAMIVLGAQNLENCPAQKYVPIYLVVMGAFGIFRNLIGFVSQVKQYKNKDDASVEQTNVARSGLQGCFDCFLFAWFIAGNVWIYRIWKPNFDDVNHELYCDKNMYLFAFGITTVCYALIGLSCVIICCMGICVGVCKACMK